MDRAQVVFPDISLVVQHLFIEELGVLVGSSSFDDLINK
jgi:hypothetical protein